VKQIGETDKRNRGESNTTWTRVVRVCPGTGHGNFLRVPLRCQVQWQEAMTFLRQFLRNRTIVPSKVACMICVDGQLWSRGSQRSRTPVHHPLRLVAEEVVSGPVWYWVWPVRVGKRGRRDERRAVGGGWVLLLPQVRHARPRGFWRSGRAPRDWGD